MPKTRNATVPRCASFDESFPIKIHYSKYKANKSIEIAEDRTNFMACSILVFLHGSAFLR
jgi:hypothetical protein